MTYAPLLDVVAAAMIAAAVLLLASRAVLALCARSTGALPANPDRWIGHGGSYFWIGPLIVSRFYDHGGFEASLDRFSGEQGRARTLSVSFAWTNWQIDAHESTVRYLFALPWLCFALADLWWAGQAAYAGNLPRAAMYVGLASINAFIILLAYTADQAASKAHYAELHADGEAHEAYARGLNDGIRYAEHRDRFTAGTLVQEPVRPANPYAAA